MKFHEKDLSTFMTNLFFPFNETQNLQQTTQNKVFKVAFTLGHFQAPGLLE